jgi:hypothetical protein
MLTIEAVDQRGHPGPRPLRFVTRTGERLARWCM